MKRDADRIFARYGDRICVEPSGAAQTVRAFLQPVQSKSWQNMEHLFQGLGQIPRGQYLYLGPADTPVGQGMELRRGQTRFLVRHAEQFFVADAAIYWFALCVQKGEEDPWNS